MLNILPNEEKKKLRNEYYWRLATFVFIFAAFATFATAASLFPAYLYITAERNAQNATLALVEAPAAQEDVYKTVRETKEKMAALKGGSETRVLPLLAKVIAVRESGISISDFLFDRAGHTIQIEGKATTRAALVSFRKKLEETPGFGSIDLPISDLAKSSNIEFRLTVLLTEPKTP